ncbi:MAG: DUF6461 domain-containing protein [Actinomycetota bacterium]|nr:DUF6461 domain-containing protein [Actinomycetota bacterium]
MLGLDQVRRYLWADEDTNLAWTLAVVTGRTPHEVIEAYGGDPHQRPEALPFADAQVPPDELGVYSLVQLREADGHIVAIENNGWRGKASEVAERASARGAGYISVFWNLNANHKLTAAADGKLTASFDPLTVQHPVFVGETYPDWINDVVFTDEELHAILLAVVEQQTGLVVDPAWLTDPLPTYRVPS